MTVRHNAGVNVSSRTAYAMGRIGAFPRFLARVHPKHHSPALAIVTGFVITVAVTLGLGLSYDPVTAFVMVATALVIVLAAIYIVMNAACIGFFGRAARRPNPVLWLVIPVLGIVTFVPAWLTAAGTSVVKMPKQYLPAAGPMRGAHARLRELARAYRG